MEVYYIILSFAVALKIFVEVINHLKVYAFVWWSKMYTLFWGSCLKNANSSTMDKAVILLCSLSYKASLSVCNLHLIEYLTLWLI